MTEICLASPSLTFFFFFAHFCPFLLIFGTPKRGKTRPWGGGPRLENGCKLPDHPQGAGGKFSQATPCPVLTFPEHVARRMSTFDSSAGGGLVEEMVQVATLYPSVARNTAGGVGRPRWVGGGLLKGRSAPDLCGVGGDSAGLKSREETRLRRTAASTSVARTRATHYHLLHSPFAWMAVQDLQDGPGGLNLGAEKLSFCGDFQTYQTFL